MRALALALVIPGLLAVMAYSGLTVAFRQDLIAFGTVFGQLPWLVPALGIGAVLALLSTVLMGIKRAVFPAFVSLLVALAAGAMFAGPASMKRTASQVPAIHDITTDRADPPVFVAVLPLRADAPNPPEYDAKQGPLQAEGYPGLAPLIVERPYAEVFPLAVEAARAEGLRLVAADPAAGRIEGVATTRWFGFKDDVVIRLRDAHDIATVVDIRSKSRMGRSDVGANAARIERLLGSIEDAAG